MAIKAGGRAALLRHRALIYRDAGDYASLISGFLRCGLVDGARVYAVVPGDRHAGLRAALGHHSEDLEFADMTSLGANPARIIPAIEALTAGEPRPLRVVTEPIWPGRTAAEIREATRHEALINLAFAGRDVQILCPYDAARLPGAVLGDARRTHPQVTGSEGIPASKGFAGAGRLPASCTVPLPPRPAGAAALTFDGDLRWLKHYGFGAFDVPTLSGGVGA